MSQGYGLTLAIVKTSQALEVETAEKFDTWTPHHGTTDLIDSLCGHRTSLGFVSHARRRGRVSNESWLLDKHPDGYVKP